MTQPVELGLDYIQDLHAANQRLREQAAAVQVVMPSGMRAWLITRYPQARPALADPRLGKQAVTLLSGEIAYSPDPLELLADGEALICCARPRTDVVLDM